jgi:hypothetical protein
MHALKEWAVVCKALEQGRQTVLLRKGGILEYKQGFEVKHDRFLLFPTFEHQSREHLQSDYSDMLEKVNSSQPARGVARLSCYAEAVYVSEVADREVLRRLGRFHIWNESYVNARMDYNPAKPMSVILMRVFRLQSPVDVSNQPEWAGCRSWVPLNAGDDFKAAPVMDDEAFERVAREFREVLSVAA